MALFCASSRTLTGDGRVTLRGSGFLRATGRAPVKHEAQPDPALPSLTAAPRNMPRDPLARNPPSLAVTSVGSSPTLHRVFVSEGAHSSSQRCAWGLFQRGNAPPTKTTARHERPAPNSPPKGSACSADAETRGRSAALLSPGSDCARPVVRMVPSGLSTQDSQCPSSGYWGTHRFSHGAGVERTLLTIRINLIE